jgi:DHA1 family purine ribonucleoside efflux pump-like MFS transporter
LDAGAVAVALLAYGAANFLGNGAGGVAADKSLVVGFSVTCLLLGLSALALATMGTSFVPALAFSALWGFAFGAAPVLTQTWMGRAAPDQLEGVGGLFIATFQFSIALGAIAGGLAVDTYGVSAPLLATAVCGVLAAVVIGLQPSSGETAATSTAR